MPRRLNETEGPETRLRGWRVLWSNAGLSALLASLPALAASPAALDAVGLRLGLGPEISHETIAVVAFAFNLLVTALVALHLAHGEEKKRDGPGASKRGPRD
jgi:hypothetical protein